MKEEMQPTAQDTSFGLVADKTKASSNSSNEELYEFFKVEKTPFTVVKDNTGDEPKWYVLMGNYRLTEPLKNKRQAMMEAHAIRWDKIIQVLTIALDDHLALHHKPNHPPAWEDKAPNHDSK